MRKETSKFVDFFLNLTPTFSSREGCGNPQLTWRLDLFLAAVVAASAAVLSSRRAALTARASSARR